MESEISVSDAISKLRASARLLASAQNNGPDDKKDILISIQYSDNSDDYLIISNNLPQGQAATIQLDQSKSGVNSFSILVRFDKYLRVVGTREAPPGKPFKSCNVWFMWNQAAEEILIHGAP